MAAPPILKRFEAHIYKRRPGVPPALDAIVPAAARIDFYQQGVTVRTTVFVNYTDPTPIGPGVPNPPPSTSVDIWHIGSVRLYDSLQYGLNPSITLTASVFGDTNP